MRGAIAQDKKPSPGWRAGDACSSAWGRPEIRVPDVVSAEHLACMHDIGVSAEIEFRQAQSDNSQEDAGLGVELALAGILESGGVVPVSLLFAMSQHNGGRCLGSHGLLGDYPCDEKRQQNSKTAMPRATRKGS